MKYIITHCNPANNWLASKVNVYDMTGDYLCLKTGVSLIDLTGQPIIEDFSNIINYFTGLSDGKWAVRNIKVDPVDSYDIMGEEYFEIEEPLFDETGSITGSGLLTGYRSVVEEVIPVFDLRIKDYSYDIPNSERNWFVRSTNLPETIESGIVKIWKSF